MLVKILGGIDFAAAIAFLMLIFGLEVFTPFLLFCAGLLLLKGMFIFTGDVLSFVDVFSSSMLFLSLLFSLPVILLWIPAFFLLSKGIVSFI
ncbi:hypothetical protein HYV50_02755 [Candidatus Pacearchaeota archaeon]|nr:hypothetical protein [Candidatus Pacearchaeota archaeon]